MSHLFLSYASQDRDRARALVARLEGEGWPVWWDRAIEPGVRYDREIEGALARAACVLVLWSEHSVRSDWVRWEAQEALERRRLVPARIDACAPPPEFARTQLVDLRAFLEGREDPDDELGKLVRTVRALMERERSDAPAPPSRDASAGLTPEYGPGSEFESRPRVAVLPFRSLGGGGEQGDFVDGACEDLVRSLSTWRSFPVIAYSATLAYKGRTADVRTVGEELGAAYVVQGSLRRRGDQIRIDAELIHAATRQQIWSERFSVALDAFWDTQEEISQTIARQIHPALHEVEWKKAERKRPTDMNAWDLALRAHAMWDRHTREDNLRAREMAGRALELDPRSHFAALTLSKSRYLDVFYGWAEDTGKSIRDFREATDRCVEIEFADPDSQVMLGLSYMLRGERERAIESLLRAVELNPSQALARLMLGQLQILAGQAREGIEHLERALVLAPNQETAWGDYGAMALGRFSLGEYDLAIGAAVECIRRRPQFPFPYAISAASAHCAGDADEARRWIERLRREAPDFKRRDLMFVVGAAPEEVRTRFTRALGALGIDLETW